MSVSVQHLPDPACTLNLHLAVCHLEQQEVARGATANCNEAWMERGIQDMKELMRYRLSSAPEKVFVNSRLLGIALAASAAARMRS